MLKFHVIGRELTQILMLETSKSWIFDQHIRKIFLEMDESLKMNQSPSKISWLEVSTQNLWKQISAAPGFKPAYNPYTEPSMEVFGILA